MLPSGADLLRWYDVNRRTLPWRAAPGEPADPYRVWLSEVMLQQTTVAAVGPRFERFLRRFPDVAALAAAAPEAVMQEWAGLGYYARARNLHASARAVARDGWPDSPGGLRALPGVGAYTATAIGAIAFGWPGVPVDGNVERVAARIAAIREPFPAGRRAAAAVARALGEDPAAQSRPSDFAQSLFDLGATICTRTPVCALCPWRQACAAHAQGIAAVLPARIPKLARPVRFGTAYVLTDAQHRILIRRRPPRGLLGGMPELPGTAWEPAPPAATPPAAESTWTACGEVHHVFTHFVLRLSVARATVGTIAIPEGGWLVPADALEATGLPTVMLRAARLGLG